MANEITANLNLGGANQFLGVYHVIMRLLRAGAWLRASSNGTTKVVNDDPSTHTLFPLSNVGSGGSAANITTVIPHPYGHIATVTGVSGLVSPTSASGKSEGNYLTISNSAGNNGTHQIYEVISNLSCKILIRSGTAVVDNSGAIGWQEKTVLPTSVSYALDAAQWWACLELMETIQLNVTGAAGTFIVGETVWQGTYAKGELVGIVLDTGGSGSGWLIIQPMVGVFAASGAVYGTTSLASANASAVYRFRRQLVFTKGSGANTYTGSAWYQIVRHDTEAAELYSAKASNVNCTATVAPGASITSGNRQMDPAVADSFYVIRCQDNRTWNGTNALVHADGIWGPGANSPNGLLHISVANLMPRDGRAADGTWWAFWGNNTSANFGNGGNLLGQFRIDNGDPGEPEVIITYRQTASGLSRDAATGAYNGTGVTPFYWSHVWWYLGTSSAAQFPKVMRRAVGVVAGNAYVDYSYNAVSESGFHWGSDAAVHVNFGYTVRLWCHPGQRPPAYKEQVSVMDGRGRMRWFYASNVGDMWDLLDDKQLVVLAGINQVADYGAVALGPWDGTSEPRQLY